MAAHFCNADQANGETRNEFQAWGGYSAHSGGPISKTPDVHLAVGALQYSRRCWSWSRVSLNFNLGLMPAVIVKQPSIHYYLATIPPGSTGGFIFVSAPIVPGGTISILPGGVIDELIPGRSVYGFAATPIGLTIDGWRRSRIYPFVQVDGGLVKSLSPVPFNYPGSTSGNFLASFGGGIKIRVQKSVALSLGYKLMHISNAGRGYNPGLDNNVVFAGISLLK